MKILLFLAFSIMTARAETIVYKTNSYEEARDAQTYFKFIGSSTKIGMITTSFDGYAKKAELSFEEKGTDFVELRLVIDPEKLDTGISKRDNKMHEKCLETDKYKVITIDVPKMSKTAERQVVDGVMHVHGKEVPLKITIKKTNDKTFTGSSSFKLSDADIPDPSFSLAKVKDEFEIKFRLAL